MTALRPFLVLLFLLPTVALAAEPQKVPILLDTDIGSDIDDAFALALVLASPEFDLRGITTVSGDTHQRALMCCRWLTHIGRKDVPVASGRGTQPAAEIALQAQYARHAAVVWNRTSKPLKEGAVDFLYNHLKADQGKLTIVAVGPLTNVAQLLTEHPDCKPWIKRIVLMGGSVHVGYNGKKTPEPEYNIKSDIKAAQAVFTSGVPLIVAPLDATATLKLEAPLRRKIFAAGTQNNYQLMNLYQLWDEETPILYDPVAVALCLDEKLCKLEDLHLEVDDKGMTRIGKGKPNARVATSIQRDDFLKWYVERMTAGSAPVQAKSAPLNVAKLVERGGLPARVQAIEYFDTDIEKRWWMSGKLETKNVPTGRTRACRGVLTQDFDDRQGKTNYMYTAVIFNPVPGPPVGKSPRISFRYWLKGTDTLRVQIYSLSNGYHRCLTLTGLPQEKWEFGCVDMTQSRKPDGSVGPLGDNERIDDIQFYCEPTTELLISDIALYEAAAPEEKRPFPKRMLFTAPFDTGTQGKEWPGDFEIVPKPKPHSWRCAKSVLNKETETPWIRLGLRGERPLGQATHLCFRYQLTGADSIKVLLVNKTQKENHVVELKNLTKGDWAETNVDFGAAMLKPRAGDKVDEIHFLLPKGAELLLDDVLLYEPGDK